MQNHHKLNSQTVEDISYETSQSHREAPFLQKGIRLKSPLEPDLKIIAIYIDKLQGYGADRVLVKIADGLVSQGWQVDLIVSQLFSNMAPEIDPSIRVVNLKGTRYTPIRNVMALAEYLKRDRPDILFSSIHFNNIVATFALALSGIQCKLVLRQANTLKEQFKDYPLLVSKVLHALVRLSYHRADIVVAQCNAMISDLTDFMDIYREKIRVIYNPTVTADIAERASDTIKHKWLISYRSYPVILSAGRLKPQKDFETLIKAFKELKQQYSPDAKLIILGEGPLRGRLESLAKNLGIFESIDFVGFHKNPYAFMAAVDVYVSSSRYEGLPNTLIEALSLGTQVVATACKGGTSEILKYGKYGKLVPVASPHVMAKSIAEALAFPVPVITHATDDFNHEAQVDKYIDMLLQLLNQTTSGKTKRTRVIKGNFTG